MNLILVDTSIWVDFFHNSRKVKSADILQKLLEEENDICICPIIYQEILQGIRDDKTFLEIKFILQNIYLFHNDFYFDQMRNNSKIKIYYWNS